MATAEALAGGRIDQDVELEFHGALTDYRDSLARVAMHLIEPGMEIGRWAPYLNWGHRLAGEGVITTPDIVEAFSSITRTDFVPIQAWPQAATDWVCDIGHNQTNSQPSTVGQMLEWLKPEPGQKVLDVGSGSGWTTALLGKIVGEQGSVIGIERIPELVELGRQNIAKYDLPTTEIRHASEETLGLPEEAPFDRIIVSARMPAAWLKLLRRQLSTNGGIIVAPITQDEQYAEDSAPCDMTRVTRRTKAYTPEVMAQNYRFVPLVHETDERFQLRAVN
jgi:protein-L-isoaspartate(D-aspartate) O-methyltransferase